REGGVDAAGAPAQRDVLLDDAGAQRRPGDGHLGPERVVREPDDAPERFPESGYRCEVHLLWPRGIRADAVKHADVALPRWGERREGEPYLRHRGHPARQDHT